MVDSRMARSTLLADNLWVKSKVHPKYKTKYHIGNWPEYEQALVRRGDITVQPGFDGVYGSVRVWSGEGSETAGAFPSTGG